MCSFFAAMDWLDIFLRLIFFFFYFAVNSTQSNKDEKVGNKIQNFGVQNFIFHMKVEQFFQVGSAVRTSLNTKLYTPSTRNNGVPKIIRILEIWKGPSISRFFWKVMFWNLVSDFLKGQTANICWLFYSLINWRQLHIFSY